MKRFLLLSIITALLLCFCGCSASEESNLPQGPDIAEDGSILVDDVKLLSQEKRGDVTVTCYAPEPLYNLPVRPFDLGIATFHLEGTPTAEELLEQAEQNGLVVVGAASGVREGHLSNAEAYTITEFDVTFIYRGEETATKLRVQECYALATEGDRCFYRCATGTCKPMRNDVPMLLLLEKQGNSYHLICDPVSLSEPGELGAELMSLLRIS